MKEGTHMIYEKEKKSESSFVSVNTLINDEKKTVSTVVDQEKEKNMTGKNYLISPNEEEVYRYDFLYTVKESDVFSPVAYGIFKLSHFFSGVCQGEVSEVIGLLENFASVTGLRQEIEDLADRRKHGGRLNILKAWEPGTGDVLRVTITVTAEYSGGIRSELDSFTVKATGTIILASGESISGPIGQTIYTKKFTTIDPGIKGYAFVNERGYAYLSLEDFLYAMRQKERLCNQYNELK